MILGRTELLMIKRGRLWFKTDQKPDLAENQVVRLRSSRRDPGFNVTISTVALEPDNRWRVTFRLGDCIEHPRWLAWSGNASSSEAARGYTDDWWQSMREPDSEAVSDWWLNKFATIAREREMGIRGY